MSLSARLIVASLLTACTALAQSAPLPPVRPLRPVTHVSRELLGRTTSARALRDGRVLVNDVLNRRLLSFDSTLSSFVVIADSSVGAAVPYGSRPGGLFAMRGDSSVFIDPTSLSMLILDGHGAVARITSIPSAAEILYLIGGGEYGIPGFDAQGRLIVRGNTRPKPSFGSDNNDTTGLWYAADTAPVLRIDLATRRVDTLTLVRTRATSGVRSMRNGQRRIQIRSNVLPEADDWTVLPSGAVAVVRSKDYHIEVLGVDGTWTRARKVPFEWRRLTDSMKVALVDSAREARQREGSTAANRPGVAASQPGIGGAGGGGMAGAQPTGMSPTEDIFVPINELPDYVPAFSVGSMRADREGRIWIRTSFTMNGGPVYDVHSPAGIVVDRVAFPPNRVIAGFGAGVVYLGVREGDGARLEVAPTARP